MSFFDISPITTTSSDHGIREDSTKVVNQISSCTLYGKGSSLHSFPVESEIFPQKSQHSIQTFQSGQPSCPRREMSISIFSSQIPPSSTRNRLSVSTFKYAIYPRSLSTFTSVNVHISVQIMDLEARGTNTTPKSSVLATQNIAALKLKEDPVLSTSTFQEQYYPTPTLVEPSENLKKLEKRMKSLQKIFKNVRSAYTMKHPKDNPEQMKENSTTFPNPDFKVDSLILRCEYYEAATKMIRRYPFYYDFLKRCYEEGNFGGYGKLGHIRPKQENFEKAIIHAHGRDESHLKAVNSILSEIFNTEERKRLCVN